MDSCLRSPALSQVYFSFTFQLSQTAVVKPGLHIVVMVVRTVANMFLTLFQAVLIHVEHFDNNIASLTGIVINCSISSSCNDRSNHWRHVSTHVSSCIANLNLRDMVKQLPTSLRLIACMSFSLQNYSCELVNLTGTVGKVELISTFTTAVCKSSWNVSDKYTWDNAGDLKELSMDQSLSEDNGQFCHMVMHVFDNSNLSQEIFAINTWRPLICSLGHDRKHMLMILPTTWRPGLKVEMSSTFLTVPVK